MSAFHRRTYSTDTDQLDYVEKRGLAAPIASQNSPHQPRQLYDYHSRLSGDGVFGISAYGLIILSVLFCAVLLTYGIAHGVWYLCS